MGTFPYPVGVKTSNNDPNGGWKSIGTTIDNFRLITREQRPAGTTGGGLNRYGIENSGFNGYTINRSATTGGSALFGYERRANGIAGGAIQVNLSQPENNWYRTELRRCTTTDKTQAFLYSDDKSLIGNTVAASIAGHNYTNFDRVSIRGGYIYYIDFMAVANFACNEPVVSIGIEETQTIAIATVTGNNSPVCAGEDAVFNLSGTSGATVSYQINGGSGSTVVLTGGNAIIIVPGVSADQTLTLLSVDDGTCSQSLSETSIVTVNENIPVSVSISALPSGPVCAGTEVTYSATPTNGGTNPVYQWKVNGENVGTDNNVYSYLPNDGEQVSCILTSNSQCATGSASVPITYFSWDNNTKAITDSDTGLDAISISGGKYLPGGIGGTTALGPITVPKTDIVLNLGNNSAYNTGGVDYRISYRRAESVGQLFSRGNTLIISGGSVFNVSYRVDNGAGSFITVTSSNFTHNT